MLHVKVETGRYLQLPLNTSSEPLPLPTPPFGCIVGKRHKDGRVGRGGAGRGSVGNDGSRAGRSECLRVAGTWSRGGGGAGGAGSTTGGKEVGSEIVFN
jgi:hypothetical protein